MTCSNPSSPRATAMNSGSHLLPHVPKCRRSDSALFCTTSKMERDVDFLLALFTGNIVATDATLDAFLAMGCAS